MKINEKIRLICDNKYSKINSVRILIKELKNTENDELLNLLYEKEKKLRKIYKSKQVNFIAIKTAKIGIGGRPSLETINKLKKILR